MCERIITVTGGRDVEPSEAELAAFWWAALRRRATVRAGCARGVDAAVHRWFRERVGPERGACELWRAPWREFGKRAGHMRNGEMLRGVAVRATVTRWGDAPPEGRAHALVAWPGGRGTANCIEQARALGIRVVRIAELVAAHVRWTSSHVPTPTRTASAPAK